MGGVDVKMVVLEHRRQQREEEADSRRQRAVDRKAETNAGATITQER